MRPGEEDLVDGDGDGEADRFVAAGGARVAVPLRPGVIASGSLLLVAGALVLLVGLAAAMTIARRNERDLVLTRALLAEALARPAEGPAIDARSGGCTRRRSPASSPSRRRRRPTGCAASSSPT